MRWQSALSRSTETTRAIDEIAAALDPTEPPDLVFLFATPDHAAASLAARVGDALSARHLAGSTAAGVIGDGGEVEGASALAVAAGWLPEAIVSTTHVALAASEVPLPDTTPLESDFVVLADPFSADVAGVVAVLDRARPGSRKIGGLASGGEPPSPQRLYVDRAGVDGGAVVVSIGGGVAIDAVVAQGCRPIAEPMFVTRSSANRIFALDGRPALEVLRGIYDRLGSEDRALFRHSLFVGFAIEGERSEYRAGDFLVRNLIGADSSSGAIAIANEIRDGMIVQFHLRDARAAAEDLRASLERYRGEHPSARPEGALLFSCLGRGAGLYGRSGHDSELVRAAYSALPIAGFFANGEIGPVGSETYLHGYTSSVGFFRRRTA